MRKGSSGTSVKLVERIKQARDLLDEALALAKKAKHKSSSSDAPLDMKAKVHSGAIDLSMPIRAFVKKYGGDMNGARKVILLVASLTRGDSTKRLTLAEIEKHWNKMTAKGLLGTKFNRLYTSQ